MPNIVFKVFIKPIAIALLLILAVIVAGLLVEVLNFVFHFAIEKNPSIKVMNQFLATFMVVGGFMVLAEQYKRTKRSSQAEASGKTKT